MDTTSSTTSRVQRTPLGVLSIIALVLLVVGGLNWALVGIAGVDLVAMLFGTLSVLSRIVYILVGLSAVYWLIVFANGRVMVR